MPMAKKVYVFRPNNERGLSAEILANTIKEKADVPVMIEPDVNTAVSKALEAAQPEDIQALGDLVEAVLKQRNICVVGSESALEKNREILKQIEPLVQ